MTQSTAQLSRILVGFAKTFTKNVKARHQVSGGIQSEFGYYIDFSTDLGYQRATKQLIDTIVNTLSQYKFFGFETLPNGVAFRLNVNDTVNFEHSKLF